MSKTELNGKTLPHEDDEGATDDDALEDGGKKAPTIEVEIPVSEIHDSILDELRQAGLDVERQLGEGLTPHAEDVIHQMYQQGRFGQ